MPLLHLLGAQLWRGWAKPVADQAVRPRGAEHLAQLQQQLLHYLQGLHAAGQEDGSSGGGGGGGGGSGGGDRFASPRRSVLDRTSDLTTLSLPAPPVVYHPLYSAPMLPPGHRFPMVHR